MQLDISLRNHVLRNAELSDDRLRRANSVTHRSERRVRCETGWNDTIATNIEIIESIHLAVGVGDVSFWVQTDKVSVVNT